MNRADLMRSVLKDGGWHTRRDVFERVGFMLTNNAASELRARGFNIAHKREGRIDLYRLLGGAECNGTGQETARDDGLSLTALRSSEQAAPPQGAPSPEAACSPLQLELTVAA